MPALFQELAAEIINPLTNIASTISANLSGGLVGVMTVCIAIWLVYFSYQLMMGKMHHPVEDFVWRIFRIMVVISLALGAGVFQKVIITNIFTAPSWLLGASAGIDMVNIGTMFDVSIQHAINSAKWVLQRATGPVDTFMAGLIALVMLVVSTLACLYAFIMMMLAMVAICVIVGIGPLFIIAAAFDYTRKYFEAWVTQLVSFVFVIVIIGIGTQLIFRLFDKLTKSIGTTVLDDLWALVVVLVASGLAYLYTRQAEMIARGLAPGAWHLSDVGAYRGITGLAAAAAKAVTTPVARMIGSGATRGASSFVNWGSRSTRSAYQRTRERNARVDTSQGGDNHDRHHDGHHHHGGH